MDQPVGSNPSAFRPDLISPEFRSWYLDLLKKIFGKQISFKVITIHPHFLIKEKSLNINTKKIIDSFFIAGPKKEFINLSGLTSTHFQLPSNSIVFLNEEMKIKFSPFQNYSFRRFLINMPPITSAELFQDPKKLSRMLTLNSRQWFVAIEICLPEVYLNNRLTLDEFFRDFSSFFGYKIQITNNWLLICEGGKYFFITPFLGATLEQKLKCGKIDSEIRKKLIKIFQKVSKETEEKNIFWRDLAPRNAFLKNNHILFTDFENVFRLDRLPKEDLELMKFFRRIWFSDVFEPQEVDDIFGNNNNKISYPYSYVKADGVEKEYFKKDRITINERNYLLSITKKIERKHTYLKKAIYGHRIGRYISDFLEPKYESILCKTAEKMNKDEISYYLAMLQFFIDLDQETLLRSFYLDEKDRNYWTSMFIKFFNSSKISIKPLPKKIILDRFINYDEKERIAKSIISSLK